MKSFKISGLLFATVAGLLIGFLLPKDVFAWGSTGHEAVASIAWRQMNPNARKEALALIKRVPQLTSPALKKIDGFDQWVSELPPGLSTANKNLFLFMRAATWADSIKHVGFVDSDDPPPGVSVDHPIGFNDPESHGYWHFVDNGLTSDGSTVLSTPVPNAAVQIVELRTRLTSETDPDLAAYELVWLLHLVGDLHQPLHGARRFVANHSDLGGNSAKISLSNALQQKFTANRPVGARGSPPANLHAFWDDLPGVTSDPTLALKPAANFATGLPPANSTVNDTDPANWSEKSFQLAKQDGYVTPIGPGNTNSQGHAVAMTTSYYTKALSDGKTQIELAGERLAKMLNDRWPATTPPNHKK